MYMYIHNAYIHMHSNYTLPKSFGLTTSQRFELWRAEPNRFLIYLLNHSDTMSLLRVQAEANWRRGLAR